VSGVRERLRRAAKDVFVVLPAGAGKPAVYQVPGVLLDGLVVVVSPLIALQRDQVAALRGNGAGRRRTAVCRSWSIVDKWFTGADPPPTAARPGSP
jgi:superfamily II DNA helicase RecQ